MQNEQVEWIINWIVFVVGGGGRGGLLYLFYLY